MIELAYSTARLVAGVAALLLLWAAFFLKIDEERRVHRAIEIWRDRLAEWPVTTRQRRRRWLALSAAMAAALLNRVFGKRLLSYRAFVLSATLSVLSVVGTLTVLYLLDDGAVPWRVVIATVGLGIGMSAPVVQRGTERWSLAIVALVAFWPIVHDLVSSEDAWLISLSVVLAVFAGTTSNFIFIAAVRRTIPRVVKTPTLVMVLALFFGSILVVMALAIGSYMLGTTATLQPIADAIRPTEADDFVFTVLLNMISGVFVVISNAGVIVAGALVALITIILMVDSMLWAVLERPVYALARYEVIKNKKLLVGLAAALLAVSSPRAAEFVKSVAALAK